MTEEHDEMYYDMLDWEDEYEREQENKMEELTDKDVGEFLLTTQHSRYILNTSKETLRREPGVWANFLRRDEEDVPLLGIVVCRVGSPAYFRLVLNKDNVGYATRGTTEVLSIERIR